MFFTLNNVLKKPKKTVHKTMNFDFKKLLKKKSLEHNKCHDIFSIPLLMPTLAKGPDNKKKPNNIKRGGGRRTSKVKRTIKLKWHK